VVIYVKLCLLSSLTENSVSLLLPYPQDSFFYGISVYTNA
jgi:hypothetical protein